MKSYTVVPPNNFGALSELHTAQLALLSDGKFPVALGEIQ
jgi:hypothetical protein